MENRLLDPLEAAKMLSVSRRTIYRLRDLGKIPTVKIGRLVRFRLSDVEEFIAGCPDGDDYDLIAELQAGEEGGAA